MVLRSAPLALLAACGDGSRARLPSAHVDCGGVTVEAELAADPSARARGLMFRRELPDGTGMLFAFPADGRPAFAMSDTSLALDLVFLDARGTITAADQLEPFDASSKGPPSPVRYALEVPLGWMRENGLRVGDRCALGLPAGFSAR